MIAITEATAADIPETLDFVMRARAEIFPMLDPLKLPDDLARFEAVYLSGEGGRFLIARHEAQIVAAIGYLPYDHRFAQLDYAGRRTVEIVRLFVAHGFRGEGLAGKIYQALKQCAEEDAIEMLYLHTHPFLPGAIGFWQKQGFEIVDVEADPVWQTTHMQRVIRPSV
ncbi:GNAT family N-acetyltransferase [Pseudomonas sp. v388]|uniref:GNAT family N-acetyltransferase n=1 Tax=Pseudomonas sp. v388 TaxID=2479849 RepID=UPI000F7A8FB1|nr:GNAT family N-acetyltransferase [Pseudomonas sp. v388]RRV04546.1 GNAT family N-acetyltransferase [Pseudomonas sp. v388]